MPYPITPDNDGTETQITNDLIPGMSAEDLQTFLDARFGADQTGLNPPENNDEPPADNNTPPVEGQTPPSEDDNDSSTDDDDETPGPVVYELDLGERGKIGFTAEQLKYFHEFQQVLTTDEKLRNTLENWYNQPPSPAPVSDGQQEGSPPPPPPAVHPELAPELLEDPAVKFLYDQNKALEEKLNSIQGMTDATLQQQQQTQRAQVEALFNKAVTTFSAENSLTQDEALRIAEAAGRTSAALTYMNGIHPVTGLPVSPDPLAAMETAMEMAMWSMPEFRSRVIKQQIKTQREDRNKKDKLSALSGNSGSTPRTPTAPRNDTERRAAMISEVAEAMGGGE